MKYPSWFLEIVRCPAEGSSLQFVAKMNPGYKKPRLAKPPGLINIREFEVYGGYAYLVVANR